MRRRLLESLGVAAVMVALVMLPAAVGRGPGAGGQAGRSGQRAGSEDGVGPSRSPGDLARRVRYPARTARPVRQPGVLHRRRSGPHRMTSVRATSAATAASSAGASRTSPARTTRCSRRRSRRADGRRWSSSRPNGRIPALTPQAQERNRLDREFRLALLQNTDTCKSKAPACNGGQYGPPSPRLAEVAPFYNTQRMNRHDGPEDQSLGDRCMLGSDAGLQRVPPHRAGAGLRRDRRRHRAGPGLPARGLSEREPSAEQHPPPPRRLARPLRGQYAGRRDHEFLAEVPVPRRRREPEARRTVHAGRCEHAGVRGHDHGPDGVDGALDRQAGADDAVGRSEPHLLRAAVPRGELRAAGAAHRRAHGREGVRGRARSGSGVAGHRHATSELGRVGASQAGRSRSAQS